MSAPSEKGLMPNLDAKQLKVLFDGKSLDGWEFDPNVWTIQNGAMHNWKSANPEEPAHVVFVVVGAERADETPRGADRDE